MPTHLQVLLKKRGMSKAELSRKSGVALSFINYIYTGKKSPTVRTLQKLAEALDVSIVELLDDNHSKTTS